jgi:hypothetical protein
MTSSALRHYPAAADLPRLLTVGFIAGALSVLIFHQGAVSLLHAFGLVANPAYSMAPTRPWGIPQLWSSAFWGGVWGVLLAASLSRVKGLRLILAALVFGALLPTLVAWFVVAPLKGQPIAAGGVASRMMIGLVLNGTWGLGAGIGLALFGRSNTA